MKQVFIHTNLIDVLDGKLIPDCSVFVEDGIITDITNASPHDNSSMNIKTENLTGNPYSDVVSVIDLGGKYMTPGFFDCHVHLVTDALPEALFKKKTPVGYTLTALENLESLTKAGVTFARDVGDVHNVAIELREAIKAGRIKLAPDLQSSGQPICMTGGTCWHKFGYEADGVDECRKAARLMLKNGADVVKLMGTGGVCAEGSKRGSIQLSEEELRAAVIEAHHVGAKACCHSQNIEGNQTAIRAGVDIIEHGDNVDDETVQMMLEHGTIYDATLASLKWIIEGGNQGVSPAALAKAKEAQAQCFASFRKVYDAGVLCILGSDSGTQFCKFEDSLYEMVVMVENCGLTPAEALKIGTINSAIACDVDHILGSVTVGKKAHLVVFDENPLENINVVLNPQMTIKNGEIIWAK